jgi:hypothetical protein
MTRLVGLLAAAALFLSFAGAIFGELRGRAFVDQLADHNQRVRDGYIFEQRSMSVTTPNPSFTQKQQ